MKTLTTQQTKRIFENNGEYLIWADGSPITEEELENFLLIEKNGVYSLTLPDNDFYIEDIVVV